jgi:hypothetical protein
MEFIGELERLFATTLYPYRIPIAIAGIAVASLLAIAAVRGRWDLVARRHPRGTTALLVPVLVIGLPLGWYLGSPLFLSTTVDEPPPVVAGPVDPSPDPSPIASPLDPAASGTAAPSPAGPSTAAPLLSLAGEFTGADEFHFGRGNALLIETEPGSYTVRLEGFEVRNGPDLFVYLSPSAEGYTDGAIELAALKADRGNQNYEVPAGTSIEDVRSIVIWCKQFAVLFATAPLS